MVVYIFKQKLYILITIDIMKIICYNTDNLTRRSIVMFRFELNNNNNNNLNAYSMGFIFVVDII